MDILTKILLSKQEEVEKARQKIPEREMRARAGQAGQKRGFFQALSSPGPEGANIIAEFKKASPSKGPIHPDMDPARQARLYKEGGAAALSVLTDQDYFSGSLEDLKAARAAVDLPVLRKDFIVSSYQLYEAAAMGADAALLIVRAVPPEFLKDALALCADLGLDALVEVHSEEELETATRAGAKLVGINNRNLKTFVTDLGTTVRLAKMLDSGQVGVGESGIRDRADIEKLLAAGVFNFLIGESLVRADDPASLLGSLLGKGEQPRP